MFSAILILLTLPFTDLSRSRGIQFRPLSKIAFFIFVGNFLVLLQLGAVHVETPFIELGQISTVIYFAYFLIMIPVISLLENSLLELKSVASSDKREVNAKDVEMATILPNSISRALLYCSALKKYTNTILTLLAQPRGQVIGFAIYCLISVSLKQISCDAPRP